MKFVVFFGQLGGDVQGMSIKVRRFGRASEWNVNVAFNAKRLDELYEPVNMPIEGCIIGFDEYTNLVLGDAEEIHSKTK